MAAFLPGGLCPTTLCRSTQKEPISPSKPNLIKATSIFSQDLHISITAENDKSPPPAKSPIGGRRSLLCTGTALAFILTAPASRADDKKDEDKGVMDAVKTLFDPNEKTKSGKVLPKAYLKSAREVVKSLRESLKEDPNDGAKFRRTADSAKESIREYLSNWRGQQSVANEESYVELEKAFRSLAGFYSKAGPSAPLPDEVKSEIIRNLDAADEFL